MSNTPQSRVAVAVDGALTEWSVTADSSTGQCCVKNADFWGVTRYEV